MDYEGCFRKIYRIWPNREQNQWRYQLVLSSLLFSKDGLGIKKLCKICKIVGLYLLKKLLALLGEESVGFYTDDGRAAINSCCRPGLDNKRKDIIYLFKNKGVNTTRDTNLIERDIVTWIFFPYRKPNNKPLRISVKSNHYLFIIK